VARRQGDDLLELAPEHRAATEQQRARARRHYAIEGRVQVALACQRHRNDLQAKGARCRLDQFDLERGVRVQQDSDHAYFGNQLMQQREPLCTEQAAAKEGHAGQVAFRPAETADQTHFHRIVADHEYDGDGRAGGPRHYRRTIADDHGRLPADQIGGEARQPIRLIVSPALLDDDIASFDEPFLAQPFAEFHHEMRKRRGCRTAE
jgi:hypothetical protein